MLDVVAKMLNNTPPAEFPTRDNKMQAKKSIWVIKKE